MKKYKNGHAGYKVSTDEDLSKPSYFDSDDFLQYRRMVEAIVLSSESPISIRGIHMELGEKANYKYTLDALESSLVIERIAGFIDKFTQKHEKRITPQRFNDGLAENNSTPRPY